LLILVLAALWLARVWMFPGLNRQNQVIATTLTLFATLLALLLWLLLLSRLRWRVRLILFAAAILLLVAARFSVQIRGVSGDLVPLVAWRWTPVPEESLGELSAEDAPALETSSDHDYPQFLGPERDGAVRGVRLARDWSSHPPREVWRRAVGAGWSGFAVAGRYAVTQEQRGDREVVVAYHLETGAVLWSHQDEARFTHPLGGIGPRATPTLREGRVYSLGATGILNCLDLETGRRIWTRNILEDNDARQPMYGAASSPLVVDDLVVVSAGGTDGRSLVAYHRETGDPVWGGGDKRAGYSSPVVATLAGRRQILIFADPEVAAHDPLDGRVLWRQPWPGGEKVANPMPLPGDRVLASSGYGFGSKLYQVRASEDGSLESEILWETTRLKAKFANPVHREGYLYGLDDGVLACLDLEDGERRWKGGRYGHGQVILVDDLLLVQAEDGDVVLVEAVPEEHRELGRIAALQGKTWNNPALAGGYLLVRNSEEAACYELALEEEE
jgi:outer membrane protein assembly factor BamB